MIDNMICDLYLGLGWGGSGGGSGGGGGGRSTMGVCATRSVGSDRRDL